MSKRHFRQPLTPLYALGVLRATSDAQTGAEFRMRLADGGFSARECDLWAQLFETFANDSHTPATDALLKERAEDYEAATFDLFEHRMGGYDE